MFNLRSFLQPTDVWDWRKTEKIDTVINRQQDGQGDMQIDTQTGRQTENREAA